MRRFLLEKAQCRALSATRPRAYDRAEPEEIPNSSTSSIVKAPYPTPRRGFSARYCVVENL
jgi:hypothetical protein